MVFKITRDAINDFFFPSVINLLIISYLATSIDQSTYHNFPWSKIKDIQLAVVEGKIEVSEFFRIFA